MFAYFASQDKIYIFKTLQQCLQLVILTHIFVAHHIWIYGKNLNLQKFNFAVLVWNTFFENNPLLGTRSCHYGNMYTTINQHTLVHCSMLAMETFFLIMIPLVCCDRSSYLCSSAGWRPSSVFLLACPDVAGFGESSPEKLECLYRAWGNRLNYCIL